MIRWLRALFACRHRTITRVFTDPDTGRSHVVCMDCCQRYEYFWSTMTVGERIDAPRPRKYNDGLEQPVAAHPNGGVRS